MMSDMSMESSCGVQDSPGKCDCRRPLARSFTEALAANVAIRYKIFVDQFN